MDVIIVIFRFLYRKKWWLVCIPLISAIIAFMMTRNLPKVYTSNTVIYTGVISGYNLETAITGRVDIAQSNNQMENFLNIIHSYNTLHNVSLKLFAQHMMYGDTLSDTQYIRADHFRGIYHHTPAEITSLVDKTSLDTTLARFSRHETNDPNNYLYGIFMWDYGYYGKSQLEGINVSRVKTSDMIEISYTCNDPYVVYHTLQILSTEFMEQYYIIRDEEADKAIAYYTEEMARVDKLLKDEEESQKNYSIAHKVINFQEQTKEMAHISSTYTLRCQEAEITYKTSKQAIDELEKKFGKNFETIKNNRDFIKKLNHVSDISNQIALTTIFEHIEDDSTSTPSPSSSSYYALKRELDQTEQELQSNIDDYFTFTGTGEVLISKDIASEWLVQLVINEKAKKELEVLKDLGSDIDQMFSEYSPIGIHLQQQSRLISFLEAEYRSANDNLNQAKLRKRNTLMNASNLKVITPPHLPLSPEPTKRKIYIAAAGLATFVFLLGIFLIAELLGRTLRDKDRTERLTGGKVIAALPKKFTLRYKKYNNEYRQIAIKSLSNSILNKLRYQERNIVNIISLYPNVGKTELIRLLSSHWDTVGRKYRSINWKEAFDKQDREVMYPINYNDLLSFSADKILLIEHRDITSEVIQKEILQNAIINLLILDANTSWKDTDKINYTTLIEQLGDHAQSLFICLVNSEKRVVEEFTIQLPPYTIFSNISHFIYNFGHSSSNYRL